MSLSPDLDYLSLPVSLSQEVREVLDHARPATVSYSHVGSSNSTLAPGMATSSPGGRFQLIGPVVAVTHSALEVVLLLQIDLGSATRLPGMTPAAIVHLLNYVQQTNQNPRTRGRTSRPPGPQEGERTKATS
ncbi:hypothetical protein NHX12_024833 [Muraenolepis orangiensis]|uniref:Uncharacterized protein n=1 Tax=Muraenolepis orangiensis TaxID=630683 RepID=A0A9Q0IP40_9TELE|nr:hypothetical protein NHX12_024833 [Muraenolepis orangiensis]